MIDAVLAGGGVEPVAALAAERLGGTVAIALPGVDVAIGPPRYAAYVGNRLLGQPVRVPPGVVAEVPVRSGDELLGYVALLDAPPAPDAREVLELAAVAALTAVTLRDANVSRRRAAAAIFDDLRAGRGRAGPRTAARRRPLGRRERALRPRAGRARAGRDRAGGTGGAGGAAWRPRRGAAARRSRGRAPVGAAAGDVRAVAVRHRPARRAALRRAGAGGGRGGRTVVAPADRRERPSSAGR